MKKLGRLLAIVTVVALFTSYSPLVQDGGTDTPDSYIQGGGSI